MSSSRNPAGALVSPWAPAPVWGGGGRGFARSVSNCVLESFSFCIKVIPSKFKCPSLPAPPAPPRPARVHQVFEELAAIMHTLDYHCP